MMLKVYVLLLVFMNVLGYISMWYDKRLARAGKRRIPEKVLFGIALLQGCFGSYVAMRLCHHKTRHGLFSIGLPILMLFHAFIVIQIILRLR